MADDIDQAAEVEDRLHQINIDAVRALASKPEIAYKGECYNCDEPLPAPLRFCDAACRDDHAKFNKKH